MPSLSDVFGSDDMGAQPAGTSPVEDGGVDLYGGDPGTDDVNAGSDGSGATPDTLIGLTPDDGGTEADFGG